VDAALGGAGIISYQVVQELLNLALRKFARPLTTVDAKDYLRRVLVPLCEVFPDAELFESALDLQDRLSLSFHDSLIVAAALRKNCEFLYSEDMQHELRVDELTILNPFVPRAPRRSPRRKSRTPRR
jgi:predicted nucleic acid-binding protein